MGKSGKNSRTGMHRKLKRQRKDYIRRERASIKKQKRELKRKEKSRRRKMIREQGGWIHYLTGLLMGIFKTRQYNPGMPHRKKGLAGQLREDWQDSQKRKRERKKLRVQDERRKADYVKREKKNLRKEDFHLQAHKKHMKKKLRQERKKYNRRQIAGLLRNPFRIKKLNREQKIIRQRIREDIKKERKQFISGLPSQVSENISRKLKTRRARIKYALRSFRDSLGRFGEFLKMRDLRRDAAVMSLNSTVLFVAAFYIMYFANKFITILTANFFDIPAVLFSYRIFWPLYTYSTLYTRLALIVIFAMGPVISLLLTFGLYQLYIRIRKFPANFKTLILWMAFHGFNLFFGAYVAGVITRTGFVYSTEWLFFSNVFDVEEIVFMIVSVITLIIIGYFMTKQFIASATTSRLILPKTRIYFIVGKVLIPWLAGYLILFLVNFPKNPPELLVLYAVSILMIIPVFTNFNSPSNQMIKLPAGRHKAAAGWIYIAVVLAMIFVVRMILFKGISFS